MSISVSSTILLPPGLQSLTVTPVEPSPMQLIPWLRSVIIRSCSCCFLKPFRYSERFSSSRWRGLILIGMNFWVCFL
ncbi:expressed protein, partial [Phakopsora pachyrhizi]